PRLGMRQGGYPDLGGRGATTNCYEVPGHSGALWEGRRISVYGLRCDTGDIHVVPTNGERVRRAVAISCRRQGIAVDRQAALADGAVIAGTSAVRVDAERSSQHTGSRRDVAGVELVAGNGRRRRHNARNRAVE